MNELEKKAEEIRQNAEAAKQEAQAAKQEAQAAKQEAEKAKQEAKAQVDGLKSELAEREKELKDAQESINNLDKSVKDQDKTIKDLKEALDAVKNKDFKSAFRAALEAKKADIQKMFDSKAEKFGITIELKSPAAIGTGNISPNNILGVAVDPTIYAAAPAGNAFIVAFGLRPRTANKLAWIESTKQPVVDYVAELAQNQNLSDVSFQEKTRAFGKLATYMQISTEFEDWFEQLYQYCVNEGIRMIENKLDAEIAKGAGVDVTYPNKIYGLVSQATAFSPLAAEAVDDPTIADVILDAAGQIAKEGFSANAAFITWGDYRALESIKDRNGNYMFDRARSMMGPIRIYPTGHLSAGEVLVADTNAAEVYAGNGFELEFVRNGAYDAYDVYFRKAAQTKVPTANAKGLIYVDDLADAIEDLDSGKGTGATLASIKEGIDTLASAVNEDKQVETHPNE